MIYSTTRCAHAAGLGTVAASDAQYVIGKYNVADTTGTYAMIVGNGTDNTTRSNAMTVGFDGNITISGTPTASNHVATLAQTKHNYSTTEQVVGTWIDGSTIYEKTVQLNTLPSHSGNSVNNTGITGVNRIIDYKVTVGDGFKYFINLPFPNPVSTSYDFKMMIELDNNNNNEIIITIYVGVDRSDFNSNYATIRYTKTQV